MIILNEANRVKQFAADKLGIKLPKGGYNHPSNVNRNKDMNDNDLDAMIAAHNLTRPVTPDEKKLDPDTFRRYDKHNLPYKVADNNDKLYRLHQGINKPDSARDRKDELMKTYGDKLTHKYDKQFVSTPKVESPKSTSNPNTNRSFMSRHGGKVVLGVGATAAAAYGIHRYRKNKKKKEEEARRQAEEAHKKASSRRFFK